MSGRGFFADIDGPRSPLRGSEVRLDPPDAQLRETADRLTVKWQGKVAKTEAAAVNRYVTDSKPINRKMRTDPEALTPQERADVARIHRVIRKAGPLPEPMLLWRGLPPKESSKVMSAAKAELGSHGIVALDGIQSLTISPSAAATFGEESGVVLEVRAKAGAYVSGIAGSSEDEVLQRHFTKYRVVGIIEGVEFGITDVETSPRRVVQLEEM